MLDVKFRLLDTITLHSMCMYLCIYCIYCTKQYCYLLMAMTCKMHYFFYLAMYTGWAIISQKCTWNKRSDHRWATMSCCPIAVSASSFYGTLSCFPCRLLGRVGRCAFPTRNIHHAAIQCSLSHCHTVTLGLPFVIFPAVPLPVTLPWSAHNRSWSHRGIVSR